MEFTDIFDTKNSNRKLNESRDKFLSRILGIFNEEIVRIWCRSEISPFEDIGRPTIYELEETGRGSTLDFTFQDKKTKKKYVSEMKCEIQFENFKYLELHSVDQLKHHNKTAFQRFIGIANEPKKYSVKVQGKEINVNGSILVWGKTKPESIQEICDSTNLTDILSLENIINDLIKIKDNNYFDLLRQKQEWIDYLFNRLKK